MPRLILILLVGALVAAGCSDDGDDADADLTTICPTLGQVPADLDPFAALSTGSPEEVESALDEVRTLYDTLIDDIPDRAYPGEVLSATTIPATSVVPDPSTPAEDGDGATGDDEAEDEEAEAPTPKEDLELLLDAVDDAHGVLDDHDFDVAAAEEDLRRLDAFAGPEPLSEVRAAAGRLRLLVDGLCPTSAEVPPAPGAEGEATEPAADEAG